MTHQDWKIRLEARDTRDGEVQAILEKTGMLKTQDSPTFTSWIWHELSSDRVADIASELAGVMNEYAEQANLQEPDKFYTTLQQRYDVMVVVLESRGLGLDWLSDNVICPAW